MEIISLDRANDALVEQFWGVTERSNVASRVQPSRTNLAEFAAALRFVTPGEHDEVVVAVWEGRIVGGGQIWFPERDNTDKCWFEVCVDPRARAQGTGSAIVDRLEATARAERRAMALPEVFVPVGERVTHPAARFAARRGYTVSDTEVVRRLPLPIEPARREALEQRAAQGLGDRYEVSVHVGGAPETLQQGVCDISNQLGVDAPTGDVDFEAESMTPADYQHGLKHESSIGRERLTAIALQRTTGEVVAYSDLVLPQGDPAAAIQWGTFVARAHRGNRLGLAVKTANLRELARVDPGRRHVETMNAEDNPWMVQINIDLGFEVIEEALMLRKNL